MVFRDRTDAGRKLADRLLGYRDLRPIVLALPRGGVPVAFEVATALAAPLDIALVRKIGVPFQPDAFTQAVAAGWITAGDGPRGAITQLEFDRAIVRILGIGSSARKLNTLRAADGWRPRLPRGFGAEQAVRQAGGRYNAPAGADDSETWPSSQLERTHLAVQAYQLGHLSGWWRSAVTNQEAVTSALPAYTPLKKQVLGFAIRYAGAPYIWGAEGPGTFDCSGLVMWAWKQAGRSLPHSSAAMWSSTRHVSLSALQPGDLIFYGSPVHHVALYIGGGTIVHAPNAGSYVRTDSINYWKDIVGAGRL